MTVDTSPRDVDQVYVTVNVHVSDPETAGDLYAGVFGLEPLHGPAKVYDSDFEWTEWELPFSEGLIAVRFVKRGTGDGAFAAPDFVRLVSDNLAGVRKRAIDAGFVVVTEIEAIDERLSIFRMLDPEGNRIVVGSGNLWVRPSEPQTGNPS